MMKSSIFLLYCLDTQYTINQNSPIVKALKKSQHEIMFYDAEIVAQEQVEKGIVLEIKREKVKV